MSKQSKVWRADWFISCLGCKNSVWMDGDTILEATKTARKEGWFVKGRVALCPNCLKPKKEDNQK